MSGKPPIGKGNKRWNIGNSIRNSEKKEILQVIDDIYNIIEGKSMKEYDISDLLHKLSKISIPNKQTNLIKVA